MHRNLFAPLPLLVMLLLLAVGLPAHGTCRAGNPSASVNESTPSTDFYDIGGGTVTHAKTGLMWKQCAEGLSNAATPCASGTATAMTWANALKAANTANTAVFAGYTDWRLPNKKELESIVEFCGHTPSINQTVFPNTPPASFFWSGSSYVPFPTNAWGVHFYSGLTYADFKSGSYFVRLVRGGQSVDTFDLLTPATSSLAGRLYNIPGPGNADQPFLRFYNNGTLPGPVTGTLYDQSGTVLGTANAVLSASLPAKGELVLSSTDLAAIFGVSGWSGRAWMEVSSSLPAGTLGMQNLIRSAILTNMSCASDSVARNIPAVGNTDQAFVRLYNVGATSGAVRGTLYDQSGTVLGNPNSTLVASLGAKAVSVLGAADIQSATGAPTWSGRAWLTLVADFGSNLKIMNLIRDPSNTLNNMSCEFD